MLVHCSECLRLYDDVTCWTICPHGPLEFPPSSYCNKCDTVIEIQGKCEHQLEAESEPQKEKENQIKKPWLEPNINELLDSMKVKV